MSGEVNNNTVVVTLIVAIVVSLGGTIVVLTKLSSVSPMYGLTGLASDDTGTVDIIIAESIEINVPQNSIDFGDCTAVSVGSIGVTSEMTQTQANQVDDTQFNCTGTNNLPAYIEIENIGNTIANVSFNISQNGSQLLGREGNPDPGAKMWYRVTDNEGNCQGTYQTAWNLIHNANGPGDAPDYTDAYYPVCHNLSYGPSNPSINVSINLTVTSNSITEAAGRTSTLTFWANGAN